MATSFSLYCIALSPSKILPLTKISKENASACYDLINDCRRFEGDICTFDPLTNLTSLFEGITSKEARASNTNFSQLPIEEQLGKLSSWVFLSCLLFLHYTQVEPQVISGQIKNL